MNEPLKWWGNPFSRLILFVFICIADFGKILSSLCGEKKVSPKSKWNYLKVQKFDSLISWFFETFLPKADFHWNQPVDKSTSYNKHTLKLWIVINRFQTNIQQEFSFQEFFVCWAYENQKWSKQSSWFRCIIKCPLKQLNENLADLTLIGGMTWM